MSLLVPRVVRSDALDEYERRHGTLLPVEDVQEVLRALIDRADYVNRQIPCIETELGRNAMATALALFEVRAKRVKGNAKGLAFERVSDLLEASACPSCGHVSCGCSL